MTQLLQVLCADIHRDEKDKVMETIKRLLSKATTKEGVIYHKMIIMNDRKLNEYLDLAVIKKGLVQISKRLVTLCTQEDSFMDEAPEAEDRIEVGRLSMDLFTYLMNELQRGYYPLRKEEETTVATQALKDIFLTDLIESAMFHGAAADTSRQNLLLDYIVGDDPGQVELVNMLDHVLSYVICQLTAKTDAKDKVVKEVLVNDCLLLLFVFLRQTSYERHYLPSCEIAPGQIPLPRAAQPANASTGFILAAAVMVPTLVELYSFWYNPTPDDPIPNRLARFRLNQSLPFIDATLLALSGGSLFGYFRRNREAWSRDDRTQHANIAETCRRAFHHQDITDDKLLLLKRLYNSQTPFDEVQTILTAMNLRRGEYYTIPDIAAYLAMRPDVLKNPAVGEEWEDFQKDIIDHVKDPPPLQHQYNNSWSALVLALSANNQSFLQQAWVSKPVVIPQMRDGVPSVYIRHHKDKGERKSYVLRGDDESLEILLGEATVRASTGIPRVGRRRGGRRGQEEEEEAGQAARGQEEEEEKKEGQAARPATPEWSEELKAALKAALNADLRFALKGETDLKWGDVERSQCPGKQGWFVKPLLPDYLRICSDLETLHDSLSRLNENEKEIENPSDFVQQDSTLQKVLKRECLLRNMGVATFLNRLRQVEGREQIMVNISIDISHLKTFIEHFDDIDWWRTSLTDEMKNVVRYYGLTDENAWAFHQLGKISCSADLRLVIQKEILSQIYHRIFEHRFSPFDTLETDVRRGFFMERLEHKDPFKSLFG